MSCECPICFDPITSINCTTTECGHTFHSFCIFKNLSQNNGCPMCRKELVEAVEDSDEEEEDEEEDDEEEEIVSVNTANVSVLQIAETLKKKGITELDFIHLLLIELYDFENDETMEKKNEDILQIIDNIFLGKQGVDHRDKRTYADVILGKDKCGETGIGPKPVEYKKVNFVA